MLEVLCPKCGKEPLIEVINVLPGRRYEIRCKRCGTVFTAESGKSPESPSEEAKSPK